jgi:hypothetical protein
VGESVVNDVGEMIIVEGKIVTCDLKELVLNDDLGETNVGVTILSYPNDTSQIM